MSCTQSETSVTDLTYVCACVVIFWSFIDGSIKLKMKNKVHCYHI